MTTIVETANSILPQINILRKH